MSTLEHLIAAVHAAAISCNEGTSSVADASDTALLDHQRALAATARVIEAASAAVAAEVAHRSRRELGYGGLAQRLGARTPELLVQQVTGASLAAARRLVRVGTLVASSVAVPVSSAVSSSGSSSVEPWLEPLAAGAASGAISAEAVEAIRVGLGSPSGSVTQDALAHAARTLAAEAATATVDRLARRARELRAELDLAGVAAHEDELRNKRYLHLIPHHDGMTRLVGLLDPESAAIIGSAIDVATSPRRGGPRFVDPP